MYGGWSSQNSSLLAAIVFFEIEKIIDGKQHWKNMKLELRVYVYSLLLKYYQSENQLVGPVKQLMKLTWIK